MPFLLLLGIHVSVKLVDTYNFSKYKDHYNKVRIYEEKKLRRAPYLAKDKDEFNKLIFKAINTINSNEVKASLSQIRSYFEKNHMSKIITSGEKVNLRHLNSLLNRHYLELKEIKNNNSNKESFKGYILTSKAKDLLKKSELLEEEDLENSVNTNDSENLIICPNQDCGYYCQPDWKVCPICHTKLNQDILIIK